MATGAGLGSRLGGAKERLNRRFVDPNLLAGKVIRKNQNGFEHFADYFSDTSDDLDSSSDIPSPLLTRENPIGFKALTTKNATSKIDTASKENSIGRSGSRSSGRISTFVSPKRRLSVTPAKDDELFRVPVSRQSSGRRPNLSLSPRAKLPERSTAVAGPSRSFSKSPAESSKRLPDVAAVRSGRANQDVPMAEDKMTPHRWQRGGQIVRGSQEPRKSSDRVIVNGGAMDGSLTRFTKKRQQFPESVPRLSFGNCPPKVGYASKRITAESETCQKIDSSKSDSSDTEDEVAASKSFGSLRLLFSGSVGSLSKNNKSPADRAKSGPKRSKEIDQSVIRRSPRAATSQSHRDNQKDSFSKVLLVRPVSQSCLDESSSTLSSASSVGPTRGSARNDRLMTNRDSVRAETSKSSKVATTGRKPNSTSRVNEWLANSRLESSDSAENAGEPILTTYVTRGATGAAGDRSSRAITSILPTTNESAAKKILAVYSPSSEELNASSTTNDRRKTQNHTKQSPAKIRVVFARNQPEITSDTDSSEELQPKQVSLSLAGNSNSRITGRRTATVTTKAKSRMRLQSESTSDSEVENSIAKRPATESSLASSVRKILTKERNAEATSEVKERLCKSRELETSHVAVKNNVATSTSRVVSKSNSSANVNSAKKLAKSDLTSGALEVHAQFRLLRNNVFKNKGFEQNQTISARNDNTGPPTKNIISDVVVRQPSSKVGKESRTAAVLSTTLISTKAQPKSSKPKKVEEHKNNVAGIRRKVVASISKKVSRSSSSDSSDSEFSPPSTNKKVESDHFTMQLRKEAAKTVTLPSDSSSDDEVIDVLDKAETHSTFAQSLREAIARSLRTAKLSVPSGKTEGYHALTKRNLDTSTSSSSEEEEEFRANTVRAREIPPSNERQLSFRQRVLPERHSRKSSTPEKMITLRFETKLQERSNLPSRGSRHSSSRSPLNHPVVELKNSLPCSRDSGSSHTISSCSPEIMGLIPPRDSNEKRTKRDPPLIKEPEYVLTPKMKSCSVVLTKLKGKFKISSQTLVNVAELICSSEDADFVSGRDEEQPSHGETTPVGKDVSKPEIITDSGRSSDQSTTATFEKHSIKRGKRKKDIPLASGSNDAPLIGSYSPKSPLLSVQQSTGSQRVPLRRSNRKRTRATHKEAKKNSPKIALKPSASSRVDSIPVRALTPLPKANPQPLRRSTRNRNRKQLVSESGVAVVKIAGDVEASPAKRRKTVRKLQDTASPEMENGAGVLEKENQSVESKTEQFVIKRRSQPTDTVDARKHGFLKTNETSSRHPADVNVPSYEDSMVDFASVCVMNPHTQEEVLLDCVKSKTDYCYFGATGSEISDTDVNDMKMCRPLNQPFFSSGLLQLKAHTSKGLHSVAGDTLVYWVMIGPVIVTIHETSLILESGDCFFVPLGNVYNIENRTDHEVKLLFFQLKGNKSVNSQSTLGEADFEEED